jgi:hypothetical protein
LARSVRSDGATTVYGYDDARFAAVDVIDPAGNRTVGELDYHRWRRSASQIPTDGH